MTLSALKGIEKDLSREYEIFSRNFEDCENGKNEKIRSEAKVIVKNSMEYCTRIILKNKELTEFLTNDDSENVIGVFKEFENPTYFNYDMGEILRKLRRKIQQIKNSTEEE